MDKGEEGCRPHAGLVSMGLLLLLLLLLLQLTLLLVLQHAIALIGCGAVRRGRGAAVANLSEQPGYVSAAGDGGGGTTASYRGL